MKKTIAMILFSAFIGVSMTAKAEVNANFADEFCKNQANVAMAAMELRQKGLSKNETLARVGGAQNLVIVETAFATPIKKNTEEKIAAVKEMGKNFYDGCVNTMKSTD